MLRLRHDSIDSLDRLRLGAMAEQLMPATAANHFGGSLISEAMPRYPTPSQAPVQRSAAVSERSGGAASGIGARDLLGPEYIDADTILDMYRYPHRGRQRSVPNGSAANANSSYSKSTEELLLPPNAGFRSALPMATADLSCIGLCRAPRNTYESSQSERFLGAGATALSPRLVEDALLTRKLLADLDEEIVDKRRTLRRLQVEIDTRRFECDQVLEVHEELARLSSAVEQIDLDDLFTSTQQQRAAAAAAVPVAPHPVAPHLQTIMTSATTTVNTLVPHGYYLQSASAKHLPQNPSPLVGAGASLYGPNYPPLYQYYASAPPSTALSLGSRRSNDECYSSNDYLVHRRHFSPTAAEYTEYAPSYSYATNGTGATAYHSPRGEQQYASYRAAAGAAAYQQHYGGYSTLPPMGHPVQMSQSAGLAIAAPIAALPGTGLSSPPTSPNYACGYPALPELRSQVSGSYGGPFSAPGLGLVVGGGGGGGSGGGSGSGGGASSSVSGLLSASSVAASRDAPLSDPDHERTCLADGCRELDDALILEHLTRSASAGGLASGLAPSASASATLPGARRGDRDRQFLLRVVHVDSAPSVADSGKKSKDSVSAFRNIRRRLLSSH